jgi:ABC-2 type transport system ATP-binding protein
MIEVQQLTKDYGTVVAVQDLSFEVGRGEVVGFLGPNGAGKSTTLRILAGFLGPTSGSVRVAGFDVVRRPLAARRCLGYMPESSPLYPELRVREYLDFRAALKQVPRRERRAALARAMGLAGISDMAETLVGHLSRGYRQRVGLADALVASPPLLVLDEPTAGLDPNQIREVRTLIRQLGKEHTVLVSTHILSEVETTCDRAIVIDRGRLVAEGTIAELRELRQGTGARLVLKDTPERVAAVLEPLVAQLSVTDQGARGVLAEVRFGDDPQVSLERCIAVLVEAGIGVSEAVPAVASLEEVFAQLTSPSRDSARAAREGDDA